MLRLSISLQLISGLKFMDRRPQKSRPSNVLIYVVLSIAGLIGLFLLGKVFQSMDTENINQSARMKTVEQVKDDYS